MTHKSGTAWYSLSNDEALTAVETRTEGLSYDEAEKGLCVLAMAKAEGGQTLESLERALGKPGKLISKVCQS